MATISPFVQLSAFAGAMFVGSMLSGLLPLSFSFSPKRMRFITTLGVGVLIGTAFNVIIPEGVHTVYTDASSHSSLPEITSENETFMGEIERFRHVKSTLHTHDTHVGHQSWAVSYIGHSLVFGFILMLVLDRLSGHDHSHEHSPDENKDCSLEAHENHSESSNISPRAKFYDSALIGILVHAAADGLALGLISLSDNEELEFIVFIALMLHKAPSAFGLASFLMHQGRDHNQVRKQLLVFSFTAPSSAIFTYLFLGNLPIFEDQGMMGLCLLFSGGTFLYTIAAHILPTVSHAKDNTAASLAALVLGAFAPLFISGTHSHG